MTITDANERLAAAEYQVRQTNSYKEFVDPAKLSEMLSCYSGNPWAKICEKINDGAAENDRQAVEQIKGRLKSIWKRRNQIAHEDDVNPTFAGIGFWPIDKADTESTITFMFKIGLQLPYVISRELGAGGNE